MTVSVDDDLRVTVPVTGRDNPTEPEPIHRIRRRRLPWLTARRAWVLLIQVVVLGAFLAAWELGPRGHRPRALLLPSKPDLACAQGTTCPARRSR